MKSLKRNRIIALGMLLIVIVIFDGCYKKDLPAVQDYMSRDMNFKQVAFTVNLEKNNVFTQIFNADYSSEPLTFKIENGRHFDGSPAPELFKKTEVSLWKDYFTGTEASIADIVKKQYKEQKPLLDMREHSGELFFWKTDSNTVKPGLYWFDVKVTNGAGSHLFEKLLLNVRLPHPYEPYEFDDSTGIRLPPEEGGILHPNTMSGAVDYLNRALPADSVVVYFHKKGKAKNTLTFKFYDQDSLPIALSNFNMTKWDSLRFQSNMTGDYVWPFAFNRKFTTDSLSVTYDITNPFPVLSDVGTDKASISFKYNRIAFGARVNASIGLTFAIFDPGEWEVIFKYKLNPKFEDD